MWNILEQNWNDFYWLTGEIPPSLNYLVEEIENDIHMLRMGRNHILDFKKQVTIFDHEIQMRFKICCI